MNTELALAFERPVRAYFDALNRKALNGVLEVFTPDASVMPSDGEIAVGTGEIRATYEHRFTTFDYGRVVHIDETIVDGELAVVHCHSTGTLTLLGSGRTVEAVAREGFTLWNVSDRWMVRFYMNNVLKPIGSQLPARSCRTPCVARTWQSGCGDRALQAAVDAGNRAPDPTGMTHRQPETTAGTVINAGASEFEAMVRLEGIEPPALRSGAARSIR